MLEQLTYDVTFPVTGRRYQQSIVFDGGTTAITGKNGAGKSLILEMVAFALWGMDATRGPAGDYKKCFVTLIFRLKNRIYRVTRDGASVTLHEGSENEVALLWTPITSGITATNAKIIELFGYGLPVFNVANFIGQGEIEALMSMKPAERKKLIDSTIGLDTIDKVVEWAGNEASLSRKEAETLEGVLNEPTKPVEPENYRPSSEVLPLLDQAIADRSERDTINGWLARPQSQPVEPVDPCPEKDDKALEEAVSVYKTKWAASQRLQQLPEAKYTDADIEALASAWKDYQQWLAFSKLPLKPPFSMDEIKEIEHQWADWYAYEKVVAHKQTCPKCAHEFIPGHNLEAPPKPEVTGTDLTRMSAAWAQWAKWTGSEVVEPVEEPTTSLSEIDVWRRALMSASEREDLLKQVEGFDPTNDPTPLFKAKVAYLENQRQFDKQKVVYDAWAEEAKVKTGRLAELAGIDEVFSVLNTEKASSLAYERMLMGYATAMVQYQEMVDKVTEAKHRADQFKKAAQAMKDLKLRVKSYLVPSLNRVASHLIRQMTAGQEQELNSVGVTEDFEITIDGQPVETLNGSGKTVANLAVRIGLGQILTNKTFSVLMADEVDAACDDERAAAIAGCLHSLTPGIAQVLIVSHKDITADNQLAL